MNNGVTNNNNQTPAKEPTALAPMEGVKIAPVAEGPVDASNKTSAASAVSTVTQQTASIPVVSQPSTQQPVAQQPVTPQQAFKPAPVVQQKPTTPSVEPVLKGDQTVKKKKSAVPLLLIIILGLIFYAVYSTKTFQARIENLTYNCTPVTAAKEDTELDLNSTLVKDLYSRVVTNIREDLAQPEFNDNMKLYLAYRQISDEYKYDTNCNLFSDTAMEPYTCEVSTKFKPKAIDEDVVRLAIKKMYGEKTEVPLGNIRLGEHSCIGGYQYIPQRAQFVQGLCTNNTATSFKVEKKLTKATSNRNTIILTEDVQYKIAEGVEVPEMLKSGIYYYTFRLDMNYNYVFVSKTYKTKY